jgi:hypothetical protein
MALCDSGIARAVTELAERAKSATREPKFFMMTVVEERVELNVELWDEEWIIQVENNERSCKMVSKNNVSVEVQDLPL